MAYIKPRVPRPKREQAHVTVGPDGRQRFKIIFSDEELKFLAEIAERARPEPARREQIVIR